MKHIYTLTQSFDANNYHLVECDWEDESTISGDAIPRACIIDSISNRHFWNAGTVAEAEDIIEEEVNPSPAPSEEDDLYW